jgi:hypothetical protein
MHLAGLEIVSPQALSRIHMGQGIPFSTSAGVSRISFINNKSPDSTDLLLRGTSAFGWMDSRELRWQLQGVESEICVVPFSPLALKKKAEAYHISGPLGCSGLS